MDKRKLLRDIAQVRKQLFAITACTGFLLVILATLLGRGFAPTAIFTNAVLALMGFGALGFLLGKVYESVVEGPLVESYRKEAMEEIEKLKNTGSDKVAKELSTAELTPGMKVVEPVYSREGALLVREGAVLSERLIQTLRENDIVTVKIEAQRQTKSAE
ncbi:hypothetical protein GF373_08920 [bacterium]|nr:hypothetical protein [bacterium]